MEYASHPWQTNGTKRWSPEPPASLVSRTGHVILQSQRDNAANRSSDFRASAQCSISAAWRVAIACLYDTEDSAPATGHQFLASEVFLRTTMTINSRIKIIFKSYYQPQLTAHKVHIFQATWKWPDASLADMLSGLSHSIHCSAPLPCPPTILLCKKTFTLIWFGLAMGPGLKGDYDKWENNCDNSIPLCRYCFTSHNDCSVFSQTFCYHGSWKVAPLCEQWLPFSPNRLTFSTPKHTKQICCKTWYDIIAVSGWVPLTNFTRHIFTCQSTSYGMNLDWASCLNEPTMFCFAYGKQAQGMKRCQLHLF